MEKHRRAFITGILGQDGSYLCELLVSKGYKVFGLVRSKSMPEAGNRPSWMDSSVELVEGDLNDEAILRATIRDLKPDEVYNFAAVSSIKLAFDDPELTRRVNARAPEVILEAIREYSPRTRFFQASSSEIFGSVVSAPQNEDTPFHPHNPYGEAKLEAFEAVRKYRENFGVFAASGILFNHESPRRGKGFVTRKISLAAADVALWVRQGKHTGTLYGARAFAAWLLRGAARMLSNFSHRLAGRGVGVLMKIAGMLDKKLLLGDLKARRDWGYAPEYVDAAWRMLQRERPGDYVLATGVTHSVGDFVSAAFAHAGLDWRRYVEFDKRFVRPSERVETRGDASKAERELGWKASLPFEELVARMVDEDLRRLKEPSKAQIP